MSKEQNVFSAFSTIVSLLTNDRTGTVMGRKELSIIEQALFELRSIKESDPSKAMKCLENLFSNVVSTTYTRDSSLKDFNAIEQALINAQREHKLLEIIKEKVMNLVSISDGRVWDGELYQSNKITEEESVLLKGWKNE